MTQRAPRPPRAFRATAAASLASLALAAGTGWTAAPAFAAPAFGTAASAAPAAPAPLPPAAGHPVFVPDTAGAAPAARSARPAPGPPRPFDGSATLRSAWSGALGRDGAGWALTPAAGGYDARLSGGGAASLRDGGMTVTVGGRRWTLSAASLGRGAGRAAAARRGSAATPRGRYVAAPGNRVELAGNRVEFAGGDLTTWFVNGTAGLEEGWQIVRRPAGRGELWLAMAASGDLRSVAAGERGLELRVPAGGAVLRYAGLASYDATGRELPARFALHGGELRVVVQDGGARYPVTVDPFVQAATLTASDAAAGDSLTNVVISADGSVVASAAPAATVGPNTAAGAVYVFTRPASGWASGVQTAKLTIAGGGNRTLLGGFAGGLAISADGATIAAASPTFNESRGATFVFTRPGAAWADESQAATMTASDAAANDLMATVALSGDGSILAAGSPIKPAPGSIPGAGEVYLFARPLAGWASGTETARLTAPVPAAYSAFGGSVSLSTDGGTLAVGAPNVGSNGPAYVFTEPAGGWASTDSAAELSASDGAPGNYLGIGVAVSGDGSTVVAGAANAGGKGALYVYTRPAAGWVSATQTAKLAASDGQVGDDFGETVAASGDGSTLVGISPIALSHQGAAYVFVRPAAGWADGNETAKLAAASGAANDLLDTVAVSADGSTVAASASNATVNGKAAAGATYVWVASGCSDSAGALCLDDQPADRRWQVTASYSTAQGGGLAGSGTAITLASLGVSHGGLFWFFDPTNPEMLVKVLDACALNQQYWVFSSATTNVGFHLTVLDTETGRKRVYSNTDGTAAVPVQDISAFSCTAGAGHSAAGRTTPAVQRPPAPAAAAPAACATTATSLCIQDRFQLAVQYHTAQGGGSAGAGNAIGLAGLGVAQGGLFWFFAADNPEMLVKVIDACSLNNAYWLFYAAGTNVGFTLTVTDTVSGQTRTYQNTDGSAAAPVQDTSALPCGS